jgi:hypothetical protein
LLEVFVGANAEYDVRVGFDCHAALPQRAV